MSAEGRLARPLATVVNLAEYRGARLKAALGYGWLRVAGPKLGAIGATEAECHRLEIALDTFIKSVAAANEAVGFVRRFREESAPIPGTVLRFARRRRNAG